jgi:hypothetical protein
VQQPAMKVDFRRPKEQQARDADLHEARGCGRSLA